MNGIGRSDTSWDRGDLAKALIDAGTGNRSAFREVYNRTSAKLFGVCLRILGNRSEAEEALQETYLNVWRKAEAFDAARSSPITWLAALARNRAIDRLRARSGPPAGMLEEEALAVADPTASAFEKLEVRDQARVLASCIEELEARQSAAIRRAFFGGATYAELAAQEGVPLSTMKSWVRRSLLRLKECLAR